MVLKRDVESGILGQKIDGLAHSVEGMDGRLTEAVRELHAKMDQLTREGCARACPSQHSR